MKNRFLFPNLIAVLLLVAISFQSNANETIASGVFSGASGHSTSGSVSVVKTSDGFTLVLGSDFNLDGAPDPKPGFGKSGRYDLKSWLDVLRSNRGEQTYAVPTSLEIGRYNEVYIWCEKYSVSLGVASIK